MKTKKNSKKMVLNKITVAALNNSEINKIIGGDTLTCFDTCLYSCTCYTQFTNCEELTGLPDSINHCTC
jgi:hypothetical protein